MKLGAIGVRAVRFNIMRGRIDDIDEILALAMRCHALAGWHSEIYADAAALTENSLKWSDLMELRIAPVLEDAQLGEVLVRAGL